MKVLKERKYLLFVLLALMVVFAGCKGESPTAPTTPSGGGTGGSVTPPTGATVTLTVSNPTPLVSSTSTITATVTQNNSPVPNGTAVEFDASGAGKFQDSGTGVTIRTTTNGVATAVLTSASAGAVTVTAIVNNVAKQAVVNFQAQPVTPQPPDTTVTVSGITPTFGRPEGGEIVTINGKNFSTPVRVLFDFGNGVIKEGLVSSVTPTQVQVVTPAINLGAGQTLDATIKLINQAGTPSESSATTGPFTYRLAQLTPKITTISPDNGPVSGGTRITIFGEAFEAPVQVAFGTGGSWTQMQVLNVTYNQITAITPTARDVTPNGSGILTGPVDLRVLNINSGTNATSNGVFRYTPKMQITNVSPQQGLALGGTHVVIDGVGFDDPVAVSIAGAPAQVVKVTGTQVTAVTSALASPCGGGSSGAVIVTNINNGDQATSQDVNMSFTYIPVKPLIISATAGGAITPGSSVTVVVQDPGVGINGTANIRFTVNGTNVSTSPALITNGTGNQTFTIIVPATGITFPSQTCTTGTGLAGTQLGNVAGNLTFTNITTGCTDTLSNAITIEPPAPNACTPPPPNATVTPSSVAVGSAVAAGTATTSGTFSVSNAAGSAPLTVTAAVVSQTNGTFTVTPTTQQTINGGASTTFTVTADPTAAGAMSATINLTTNDPSKGTIAVQVSGSGT